MASRERGKAPAQSERLDGSLDAGNLRDVLTADSPDEYWVWAEDLGCLIPASEDQVARFRAREAALRLAHWQRQQRAAPSPAPSPAPSWRRAIVPRLRALWRT